MACGSFSLILWVFVSLPLSARPPSFPHPSVLLCVPRNKLYDSPLPPPFMLWPPPLRRSSPPLLLLSSQAKLAFLFVPACHRSSSTLPTHRATAWPSLSAVTVLEAHVSGGMFMITSTAAATASSGMKRRLPFLRCHLLLPCKRRNSSTSDTKAEGFLKSSGCMEKTVILLCVFLCCRPTQ